MVHSSQVVKVSAKLVEDLRNIWFWVIIKFACWCLLHSWILLSSFSVSHIHPAFSNLRYRRLAPALRHRDIFLLQPMGFGAEGRWKPSSVNPCFRISHYQEGVPWQGGGGFSVVCWPPSRFGPLKLHCSSSTMQWQFFFEFSLASFNLINFCWHLLVSNHVYHTAPGLYILRPIMVGQPQAHNRASGWDCGVKMGSGTLCAALRWYVHQWRWRVQHLFVGDLPERWFRRPETFKDTATSYMRPSRKTCKTHVCLVCLALS